VLSLLDVQVNALAGHRILPRDIENHRREELTSLADYCDRAGVCSRGATYLRTLSQVGRTPLKPINPIRFLSASPRLAHERIEAEEPFPKPIPAHALQVSFAVAKRRRVA